MKSVSAGAGNGRLYGVGVGPGDPELLTLKALRILREVPIICAPQAENSTESYALNIVDEYLDKDAQEVVRLFFPTNNERAAGAVWLRAADDLAKRLKAGRDVAFITEGDPMLFSTFQYVMESIRENHPDIPVEIVPGVSSVMAAAASAKTSLAAHGQTLAILPASYGIDGLKDAVANYDTVVLMKVNRSILKAMGELEELGLADKAIYVKRASTDREQVVGDIRQLSREDLDYFSLLIVRN